MKRALEIINGNVVLPDRIIENGEVYLLKMVL